MEKEIKQKVIQWFDRGIEPKAIANQFYGEVSIATIYRWISEHNATKVQELSFEDHESNENHTLDHENGTETDHNADKTVLPDTLNGLYARGETVNLSLRRKVFKEYKRTLKEFKAHSDGYTWENKNLKSMLSRFEALQDEVEIIFDFKEENYSKNLVWRALGYYIGIFQDWVYSGGAIELYLSEKQKDILNRYLNTSNFNDEFNALSEFDHEVTYAAKQVLELNGTSLDKDEFKELHNTLQGLKKLKERSKLAEGLSGSEPDSFKCLDDLSNEIVRSLEQVKDSFWGNKTLTLYKALEKRLRKLIKDTKQRTANLSLEGRDYL